MVDFTLTAKAALGGFALDAEGASLTECTDMALVSMTARNGDLGSLKSALKKKIGVELPDAGKSGSANDKQDMTVMSVGRDQWMIRFRQDKSSPLDHVVKKLGDVAAFTDQSDSWVQLELSGPAACQTLERICPIDLALESFPEGSVSRTMMEHLGVIVTRLSPDKNEENRFLLLSARSSAKSFLHALSGSPPFTGRFE